MNLGVGGFIGGAAGCGKARLVVDGAYAALSTAAMARAPLLTPPVAGQPVFNSHLSLLLLNP